MQSTRIEKVLIKSKSVLKYWNHRLSDGFVKKTLINEKRKRCGSLVKSVSAVGFAGKAAF